MQFSQISQFQGARMPNITLQILRVRHTPPIFLGAPWLTGRRAGLKPVHIAETDQPV